MFRISSVHPQEFLCRYCICRMWYVVIRVLRDTSSWYNVVLAGRKGCCSSYIYIYCKNYIFVSSRMARIPSFIKICLLVQKLKWDSTQNVTSFVILHAYILSKRSKQQLYKHEMKVKKHFYISPKHCSGKFEH